MKKILLIVYGIVCAGELIAVTYFEQLEWICKPLIMISLGGYYLAARPTNSKPILGAIVFSFAGDVLLMLQAKDELFFMLGLGSFLIAHVCYILAYMQHRNESEGLVLNGPQKIRFAFPIVLAGTGLITVLYPHLGDLKIPVILYAIVLIVMVLQGLFRYGFTSSSSFWSVFVGAVIFMISDSLIAINKFLTAVPLAGLAIMSTYMLAQFLLINGLLAHKNKGE